VYKRIEVGLYERAFVHLDGRPALYLEPGRHRIWTGRKKLEVVIVDTRRLLADLAPEQVALVPAEDLRVVAVAPGERALVTRRGRPTLWLGEGEHQVWTVERVRRGDAEPRPAVTIEIVDTTAVEAAPLRDEVKALVPASDYAEVTVPTGAVAIRYVEGVLEAVLAPGRHAAWTTLRKVHFATIELRERLLHVNAQEVMTKDRVTLRLNLAAAFRVVDARRLASIAREPEEVLYLAMQLAAREAVAARTLDELLALREALATEIAGAVADRAASLGLEVLAFGLKDVVLPGEMKALLNRVIEAQKQAEANVILRREETAATRALAQTAKVLAENPLLVRLKELEAYQELAAKVGQVHLVLGEGGLQKLQLQA
jgi:regulator of protease activity HflC (stomatin/prohibitin superfamily)